MPGAVNNEDYTIVDVTKGIYAANPFQIPDGHAQTMRNFIIRDGIVEQRRAFDLHSLAIAAGGWASAQAMILNPVVLNAACQASHKKIGAAWFDPVGATNRLIGIPTGPFGVSKSPVLAQTYLGGLVNYNGTVYASSGVGIIRLGVSNWPTSVTETLSPGGSGANAVILSRIIVHKSRLFGFAAGTNRLRFTDAPAVGANPEAWVPTINFIDFNGVGVTRIHEIVSLNNYIYVFTDAGLFSLYTSGAPSNWIVRTISPDTVVRNQFSVVVRSNLIYYVTDDGVYVTDGFDFKSISQSLSEFFQGAIQPILEQATLQPFDKGLLLTINSRNAIPIVGEPFEKIMLYTKIDNIAWTEIDLPSQSVNDPNELNLACSVETYNEDAKDYVTDIIINYVNAGSVGKTLKTFAYRYEKDLEGYNNDTTPQCSNVDITGVYTTKISLELITKAIMGTNFMRMKFFRDGLLLIGGRLPFTVVIAAYYNGKWGVADNLDLPAQDSYIDPNNLNLYEGSFIKFGITNQMCISIQLKFNITLEWAGAVPPWFGVDGRDVFSIGSIGITHTIERTAPRSQAQGQF